MNVPGATADSIERLHLWWLPNLDRRAPTLLYLHGTFRNLYQNFRKTEALREAGFAVVAVELASQKRAGVDYGGLILESSFTSLLDVARAAGTIGTIASWFATQEYDSLSKIGKVDAPILMMHGTADNTVPIELGWRLYVAAPTGARWVEFPQGSYSGLGREQPQPYRRAVRDFIEQLH